MLLGHRPRGKKYLKIEVFDGVVGCDEGGRMLEMREG